MEIRSIRIDFDKDTLEINGIVDTGAGSNES